MVSHGLRLWHVRRRYLMGTNALLPVRSGSGGRMSGYKDAHVEEIRNGWLVHLIKNPPEDWSPEAEKPRQKVMGVEIDEAETWYCRDYKDVCKALRKLFDDD